MNGVYSRDRLTTQIGCALWMILDPFIPVAFSNEDKYINIMNMKFSRYHIEFDMNYVILYFFISLYFLFKLI